MSSLSVSRPSKSFPTSPSSPITPTNPTAPSFSDVNGDGGVEKTPTARDKEWIGMRYNHSGGSSPRASVGEGSRRESVKGSQGSGSGSVSRSGSGSGSASGSGSGTAIRDQSTVMARHRDRDRERESSRGSSDREKDRSFRKSRGVGMFGNNATGNELGHLDGNGNENGMSHNGIRRTTNGGRTDRLGMSTNITSTSTSNPHSASSSSHHRRAPSPPPSSSATSFTPSDQRPKSMRVSSTAAAGIASRLGGGGKTSKSSGMTSEEEEREREFRYGTMGGQSNGNVVRERERDFGSTNGAKGQKGRDGLNGVEGADSYGSRSGGQDTGKSPGHSSSVRLSSSSSRPEEIMGYQLGPPVNIGSTDRQRGRVDDGPQDSTRGGRDVASSANLYARRIASPGSGRDGRIDGYVESPGSYRTDPRTSDGVGRPERSNESRTYATQQSFAFTSQPAKVHNLNSPPPSNFADPSVSIQPRASGPTSSPSSRPKAVVFPSRTKSDFASSQQVSLPAPPRRSSLPVNEQARQTPAQGSTDAQSPSSKKERRTATFKPGQIAPLNYGEIASAEIETSGVPEKHTVHHKASSTFRPIKRDTLPETIVNARTLLNLASPSQVPGAPDIPESKEVETPRPDSAAQGSITSSEALSAESAVGTRSGDDDRRPSVASVASGLDSGVAGIGSVDVTLSSMPASSLPRRVSSRRRLQSYSRIRPQTVDTSMSEATDGGETLVISKSDEVVEALTQGKPSESSKSKTFERTTRENGSARTLTVADDAADQERRARRGRLKRAYSTIKDNHPRAPSTAMYYSALPFYGVPPCRKVRAHTGTVVGDKIYYLGGTDSSACWTGIAVFDTESQGWSQIRPEGDTFPPLRAHTTSLVGSRLYVIGGGDGGNYSSVVWCYDIENNEWYRPHMRTVPADCPPPRRAHSTVLYKKSLVVFGGGNGSTGLNDVWALDVSDPWGLTWTKWDTTGDLPMEMGYHTANLVGHKMIIYGGSDGVGSFSHVHVLDLKTLVWTLVDTRGNYPRLSHSATQVGSYLFILGGHDGGKYADDVLLLNLVTFNWETKPIYGAVPEGRGYHVTTLHDSRLIVHGGFNGRTHFGDMHVLELAGNAYLPQVNAFTIDERAHRYVPPVKEVKQDNTTRQPPPANYI